MIEGFQIAAANRGFGEAARPGMQGGETLIEAQISRRLGQRGQQRPHGLGRHVVRSEQLGVGQGGAHRQGDIVRVTLVDEGSRGLEFVDQGCAFFHRDQRRARRTASQAFHHLLVVARVQLVLRLQLSQFQVVVARFL